MTPEIHAFVLCHAGSVRSNNEDNYYLQHRIRTCVEQKIDSADYAGAPRTFLAAVADGMGGAERGEAASLAAVRALRPASFRHMRRAAQASVRAANDEICAQMRALGARMGSTLTALYISGDRALCSNLGDSRIYLLRGGALTRLTRDHNRAQQLVELGVLTPEQAQRHPARHELTRHLGILPEEMALEPELGPEMRLEAGDRFLLCSDGLCDGVTEAQIAEALEGGGTPQRQAEALVERALAGGSRDNVTAMVVHIRDKMGWGSWTRATIRNMSRSLGCGRSRTSSERGASARCSSWSGRTSGSPTGRR